MPDAVKGNLIVGQSGGPTAVVNASLVGVIHEASSHPAVGQILGTLNGVEGILDGNLIDLRQETPETLAALRRTPSAALGSGRYKLRPGEPERILETLKALDVRYLVYIGGNDSADTAHRISLAAADRGYTLRTICVPKTVDNDLPLTDHCPGYGSVARYIAISTRDAGRDTEAMRRIDPIKLLEVPGRNAGWVAAASALGKRAEEDAPHLILPPERPVSLPRFLDTVQRVYDRLGFAVIVVAETVRDEQGSPLGAPAVEMGTTDAFGHRRLVGAAAFLSREVAIGLGIRARWEKPGTLARTSMTCVSEVDLEEAYLVGRQAVQAALRGEDDRMVTLIRESDEPYRVTTGLARLDSIANCERRLPEEYLATDGTHVTPAFVDYARPLIGGPLPEYARLRGARFTLPS